VGWGGCRVSICLFVESLLAISIDSIRGYIYIYLVRSVFAFATGLRIMLLFVSCSNYLILPLCLFASFPHPLVHSSILFQQLTTLQYPHYYNTTIHIVFSRSTKCTRPSLTFSSSRTCIPAEICFPIWKSTAALKKKIVPNS